MKAVLLICFLIGIATLTGCIDQVDVSKKKTNQFKKQTWSAITQEQGQLVGTKWYAGRYAENFGFKRTQKAVLKNVSLQSFKCKLSRDGSWYSLKRKTSCHSFLNFDFKTGNTVKTFKTIVKINNIKDVKAFTKNILRNRLAYGFVEENPFSKKTFARYWKVLRKGKVAVGMPEDYLKICWGKPLRVFNKSIDASGTRETFVYDRYFVLLENGIVRSIHKFDS